MDPHLIYESFKNLNPVFRLTAYLFFLFFFFLCFFLVREIDRVRGWKVRKLWNSNAMHHTSSFLLRVLRLIVSK